MTSHRALFAAAFIAVSSPQIASAQATTVSASPGMIVQDAKGGAVGSVIKVEQSSVVVKTDKYDVPVPIQSFARDGNSLLLGMTREQLNGAYEQSLAAANAALVVGGSVKGSGGAEVGTIDAIDGETVTIKLADGKKIQIPRSGIAGSADGAVIGMSAEELEAQLNAAAGNVQ